MNQQTWTTRRSAQQQNCLSRNRDNSTDSSSGMRLTHNRDRVVGFANILWQEHFYSHWYKREFALLEHGTMYMQETADWDTGYQPHRDVRLVSVISTLSFEEQRYINYQQHCWNTVKARQLAQAKSKAADRFNRMTNSYITYSTGCIIEQTAEKVRDSLFSSLVVHISAVLIHISFTLIHSGHHVLLSSQADTLGTG